MKNIGTGTRTVQSKKNVGRGVRLTARYVVKVAVMTAMLTALKFALSFVPNVEVVTLLILVYAAVFGAAYAVPAALVFCGIEIALYGVASWVVLYFVYWPTLALVASLLLRRRNVFVAVIIATVGSVLFGVLSACADTMVVALGISEVDLAKYWVAYYARGLYFDLIHTASNFCVVGLLFVPLCAAAERIKNATAPATAKETYYVRVPRENKEIDEDIDEEHDADEKD